MEIKSLSGLPAGEIDTLLFDLDGTLIDMKNRGIFSFYFHASKRFRDYFNPVSFYFYFGKSVRRMLANDTDHFNHDVFVEEMARFGRTTPQVIDSLSSEMVKDFRAQRSFFTPVPGAREAVDLAHRLGFRLVLVTNPVFPLQTVLYRLEWAGISPDRFIFMTSSQNMNRCKPGLEFYTRLIALLGLEPRRCLMIGNSDEDLPAHDAGIRTFLVETRLSRKYIQKNLADERLDFRGSYPDLIGWMKDARPEIC